MASKWPPVRNSAYTMRIGLFGQSDNQILSNPTIAAGDVQVSTDGGAFGNLATLPDVDPDSSGMVLLTLSAGEMNGDEIVIKAVDASGDEWHSVMLTIHTVGQTFDAVDANIDAVLADTAELQTDDVPGLIAALNDISAADVNAEVVDVLRTDTLPDSYATDGGQPTIAQAVLMMLQFLTEKEVSGTTLTVNKPDGSTAAMTFTLDSGSAPTSITRAS